MSGEHHVSNLFQMLKYDELKINLSDEIFNTLKYQYRGEGNENLVLYLPEIKFVLRLRKNHSNDNIDLLLEREKLRISLLYYYVILNPFLSIKYSTLPIIAEISNTTMKELDERLFPERPGHRKDKRILFNGVEVHPDYTFLLQFNHYQRLGDGPLLDQAPVTGFLKEILSRDYLNFRNYVYTLLTNKSFIDRYSNLMTDFQSSTYSVEIKPKQAWTAESYRRFDVCAFCMNQYFKLNEKNIATKSQYCPLDLFSGTESRMKKALRGLLETPQNNFKIFQNGEMIFGEKFPTNVDDILIDWFGESSNEKDAEWCSEHFCKLMIKVLLNDFSPNQRLSSLKTEPYLSSNKYKICSEEDTESIKKAFSESDLKCEYNYSSLPENCILNRIMELQRLDEAGLEAVSEFHENHIKEDTNEYSYLHDLISRIKFTPNGVEMPILNVAEAYTISTAAKDLSIMIALQKIPRNSHNTSEFIVEVDDSMYEVNVSVVDVGPKPISCIKKHWKRDKKILAACLNYFC